MAIFRIGFYVCVVLLGGIAAFVGLAVGGIAMTDGTLTYSYVVDGRRIGETVARAVDAARFWRMLLLWAGLPVLLGGLAAWYGWRCLTR